jgi:hypothetical protein
VFDPTTNDEPPDTTTCALGSAATPVKTTDETELDTFRSYQTLLDDQLGARTPDEYDMLNNFETDFVQTVSAEVTPIGIGMMLFPIWVFPIWPNSLLPQHLA